MLLLCFPGVSGNAEPVSAIAAISVNSGYLGGSIHDVGADGNIDSDIFLQTLEHEILMKMNAYDPLNPVENSVILLDNARTHDKFRISLMCEQYNIPAIFLPPFSYDLSPIELFFNTARSKLQSNFRRLNAESMKIQWQLALESCSTTQDCGRYYEQCFFYE